MLAYDYRAGSARLDDLPEVPISPHLYVLCDRCATSLRAPRGWILDDRRTPASSVSASRRAPVAAAQQSVDTASTETSADVEQVEPLAGADERVAATPAPAADEGQRQLAFGYT